MLQGTRSRPVHGADKLTAICEPIAYTRLDPQHLTALYTSTASYGDSFFTFFNSKQCETYREQILAFDPEDRRDMFLRNVG
jgi:hypothetical protein